MKDKKLRIIPLGGLGEVGRNMMVYEYNDEILVVDTGLMFPDSDMYGVDYIIPDISYLLDKRNKVRGIVITTDTRITPAPSVTFWRKSTRRSMPRR